MILLLGFLMMTGVAVAQQLQVQGKVTDATGEGLIGASVLVKGTTSGVITDIDGNYVLLNVNPDAILIFSFFNVISPSAFVITTVLLPLPVLYPSWLTS